MTGISTRLRIKANMIYMGEHIAHGSDVKLMHEAADKIDKLSALLRELIDIEGPQPGTAAWADKVFALLSELESQS